MIVCIISGLGDRNSGGGVLTLKTSDSTGNLRWHTCGGMGDLSVLLSPHLLSAVGGSLHVALHYYLP